MVVREVFSLAVAFVILAGISYAIFRGDETVRIIGAAGDAFANSIRAALPRAV